MAKSHKDIAYEKIRDRIIKGLVKPGQPITGEWLSSEINMSRTPIREALIRLQSESLVSLIDHKGAIVNDITTRDIAEIFQIRLVIESYATEACTEFIEESELTKTQEHLEDLLRSNSLKESLIEPGEPFMEFDNLHDLILRYAGNRHLTKLYGTLRSLILWTYHLERRIPGRLERSIQEHLNIVKALLTRDGKSAANEMKTHLRNNMDDLLKAENYKYIFKEY